MYKTINWDKFDISILDSSEVMTAWTDFNGDEMIDFGEWMLMKSQFNWFYMISDGSEYLTWVQATKAGISDEI